MTTTALSPTRNNSGAGSVTRTRTGKRDARCTQLSVRGTLGKPGPDGPNTSVLGVTPKPMLSTTPEKCLFGRDITYTSARMPGSIRFSCVSRKLATAHQVRASINVNSCSPLWRYAPSEIVRLVTRASNGAYTLQLSRLYCAVRTDDSLAPRWEVSDSRVVTVCPACPTCALLCSTTVFARF